MTLPTCARLGPCEIAAKLGEGGMGKGYRATDIKLRREVDVGVLLARFGREARLLDALRHRNVAPVFGLEESAGSALGAAASMALEQARGEATDRRADIGVAELD